MNQFENLIKGKKVLIFGLGRQGGGSGDRDWLQKHGAIVRVSDKDLTLVPEGQTAEQIDWAEIVIKNPGVPDSHELIKYAHSQSKAVYTSIALFVKYTSLKTIGITGTRGKSTTVGLIASMLEAAYPGKVLFGGNIAGTSCLQLFDDSLGKSFAVLELSSFQLHNFHDLKISPNIAVLTNLYPDHLNRYKDMAEYQFDKKAIVKYQASSDITIFNQDNPGASNIAKVSPGHLIGYSQGDVVGWETSLPGHHNLENIAAMAAVGKLLGIDEGIMRKTVKDFKGVPFRQEKIAEIAGITYINDTTSTTPTAAIKALQAATTPTIWITGGDTKNLPFDELLKEVESNQFLKKIIILGSKNIPQYTSKLEQIAGEKIVGTAMSMSNALELVRSVATQGDTILLSPGFASFDLFKNEFDRGRQFNDLVLK